MFLLRHPWPLNLPRHLLTQPLWLECPDTQRSSSYKDFVKIFLGSTPSRSDGFFSWASVIFRLLLSVVLGVLVDVSHAPDWTGGPGRQDLALLLAVSFTTPSTMLPIGQVTGKYLLSDWMSEPHSTEFYKRGGKSYQQHSQHQQCILCLELIFLSFKPARYKLKNAVGNFLQTGAKPCPGGFSGQEKE